MLGPVHRPDAVFYLVGLLIVGIVIIDILQRLGRVGVQAVVSGGVGHRRIDLYAGRFRCRLAVHAVNRLRVSTAVRRDISRVPDRQVGLLHFGLRALRDTVGSLLVDHLLLGNLPVRLKAVHQFSGLHIADFSSAVVGLLVVVLVLAVICVIVLGLAVGQVAGPHADAKGIVGIVIQKVAHIAHEIEIRVRVVRLLWVRRHTGILVGHIAIA